MKQRTSLICCWVICFVLLAFRCCYSDVGGGKRPLIVTQWDAFGYYLYVPATLIYHDYKKLDWAADIDRRYNVTGGDGMPVVMLENGNRVAKYFGGVAILQAPLFCIGHAAAQMAGYPADGFSPPYQYALAFGVLLYCLSALFLLRRILLRYFSDRITAVALLLICLATNFVQYAAVDNGLSHAYIFPLYVLVLYTTIRWHERPSAIWACATGAIVGLATICRPTEAIMLFIPLLWQTHTREAARAKWALVRRHRAHVLYAVLAGSAAILPQLLYWKSVTGSWVYDVGSKWMFLNPWFRVLTGWEKGWFIYTPVTILFVTGLFFVKRFPFKNAVLVFCLLNIWIIISWEDWRYGASYSARALMQSYPVFALTLAAFMERLPGRIWFRMTGVICIGYLIGVNIFQTVQYNSTILHYNDMNRAYYGRIYLNPAPTPLDMSLLDTGDWLPNEGNYADTAIFASTSPRTLRLEQGTSLNIAESSVGGTGVNWLKVDADMALSDTWGARLAVSLRAADTMKSISVRLDNPVGKATGRYACYVQVPRVFADGEVVVSVLSGSSTRATLNSIRITGFRASGAHAAH